MSGFIWRNGWFVRVFVMSFTLDVSILFLSVLFLNDSMAKKKGRPNRSTEREAPG